MCGWNMQWYGNVPADRNRTVRDAPPDAAPVLKNPLSDVAVWLVGSWNVHVTVSPTATVTRDGPKDMFATVTLAARTSWACAGTPTKHGRTKTASAASTDLMNAPTTHVADGFSPGQAWRSISATRNDSSSDWTRFRRGSHTDS